MENEFYIIAIGDKELAIHEKNVTLVYEDTNSVYECSTTGKRIVRRGVTSLATVEITLNIYSGSKFSDFAYDLAYDLAELARNGTICELKTPLGDVFDLVFRADVLELNAGYVNTVVFKGDCNVKK